jgi:hypothetical protein
MKYPIGLKIIGGHYHLQRFRATHSRWLLRTTLHRHHACTRLRRCAAYVERPAVRSSSLDRRDDPMQRNCVVEAWCRAGASAQIRGHASNGRLAGACPCSDTLD